MGVWASLAYASSHHTQHTKMTKSKQTNAETPKVTQQIKRLYGQLGEKAEKIEQLFLKGKSYSGEMHNWKVMYQKIKRLEKLK